MGRVDRLSSSLNAMVKADDVEPYHKCENSINGEVNLGPLPQDVVGEQVPFVYEGGTYGLCLYERWVTEDYFDEIILKMVTSVDKMDLRSAIINSSSAEELSEGEVCTASRWIEDQQPLDEHNDQVVVRLHTEDDPDKERPYLGTIEDPIPAGSLPSTVKVSEIREASAVVEPQTVELASGVPEVDEVCSVQVKYVSNRGTVAIYTTDRPVPVFIPEVEYPVGQDLNVRIIKQNAAYLTAEIELKDPDELEAISAQDIEIDPKDTSSRIFRNGNPIDIRPLPNGAQQPDEIVTFGKTEDALLGVWDVQATTEGSTNLTAGETIVVRIDSIEETQLVCFKDSFPIVCRVDTVLPAELRGEYVKVTIESVAPDRANAALAASNYSEGDVVNFRSDGSVGDVLFAVIDGHIIQLPSSGLDLSEQSFRVAIESPDLILRASVSRLPVLYSDGDQKSLIYLPSTEGESTVINGIPVDTGKLPDLTSPVILGIESVESDHIIPSVAALPDSHIPEVNESLIVELDEPTTEVTASATGEHLPVEVWKPPSLQLEQTYARIFDCQGNKMSAVVAAMAESNSPEEIVGVLQLATSLVAESEYVGAKNVLSAARSQLPSEYPVADAIINARYVLLCAANFLSDDTDTSIVENLREARNKIKNISEGQLSDDLSQILEGCDLEIRAAIACVEAYKNVNRDTTSRLQAIARGAEAKKPIKGAIEKLQTAAQRVDETEFDSTSPSQEIIYFLHQFEERFPYPIDELVSWRTEHEGQVSNNEWLDAVLPIDPNSIGGKPSYFEVKPDDSRSEEIWNRPTIDDEAIIQPTTRNSQKKHQQTAQQSIPEETPSSQAVSIRTDSNKDDTSDDRTTEVTPSTAPDNSSEANDTSRSDRIDADISQAESPPSIEKEETTKTTNAPQDVESEPPTATEPSEPPSDSEEEAVDQFQTRVNTEVPDATAKLRKLRKQAEADATENPVKHTQSTSSGTQYQRSDKIREYALARADGQCEACGNAAPFDTPGGEPFLEVHHVDELGKGGADDPTLVVAICPNCHREVHYGEYGDELNEELRAKLEEGLGNVGAG